MTAPMTNLGWVAQNLSGATLHGDSHANVMRVHTDTRTVEPGDLFLALKGERFDANDFLHEAAQRGAVAVICHPQADTARVPAGLPRIEVPDTRAALAQLASAWRAQFQLPLIAVTGSNGKTTVTQMLAAILEAFRPNGSALATRGNLNNDIGVPLTLLRLRPQHTIAVVELGMNHPGEIAQLAEITRPTVALVNNAQREHLEFMQTVEAVARENGGVISALPADGVAVYPADDAYTPVWTGLAGGRKVLTFGIDGKAGTNTLACVRAHWEQGAWKVHAQGVGVDLHYHLGIAGRHNVKNSLAAAACAIAAGVDANAIVKGLEAFVAVKGRSRALALSVLGRECTLIDDSYNANPDSVKAAIDVLADLPGPHMLVLGDMGEVGHEGPRFHAEAGRYAQAKGITHLLALGEQARAAVDVFPDGKHFTSIEDLNQAVLDTMPHVHSVLVKGSRFMRMERVVEALQQHAHTHGAVL